MGVARLEFLVNFRSFREFSEWFGVFLEGYGVGENFDIRMSRIAQNVLGRTLGHNPMIESIQNYGQITVGVFCQFCGEFTEERQDFHS